MSIDKIASLVNENGIVGEIYYLPYNINSVKVLVGMPPMPITGLDYILAKHNQPQTKLVMGLNGKGKFLQNKNQSGIIEIGILDTTISCGGLQLLEAVGIPLTIVVEDLACVGTSFVFALECRRVETPEWRRSRNSQIQVFTFETPQLLISQGMRAFEVN